MQPHEPERRCILSGSHGPRAGLIRLALGPDGTVAPDLMARAGGRGAWIAVDRETLDAAQKKGRLRGALARALKTQELTLPDDLGARIAAGLERACMDRLGLEMRMGALILGTDRIAEALASGGVRLLLHAADAGDDGLRALGERAARHAPDAAVITLACTREALSRALGRANVVHIAVADSGSADRIAAAAERWRDFTGLKSGGRVANHPDVPASPTPVLQG